MAEPARSDYLRVADEADRAPSADEVRGALARLLRDARLTAAAKLCYCELWHLAGYRPGPVSLTYALLAAPLGRDPRGARRWIAELAARGLVTVQVDHAGELVAYAHDSAAVIRRGAHLPDPQRELPGLTDPAAADARVTDSADTAPYPPTHIPIPSIRTLHGYTETGICAGDGDETTSEVVSSPPPCASPSLRLPYTSGARESADAAPHPPTPAGLPSGADPRVIDSSRGVRAMLPGPDRPRSIGELLAQSPAIDARSAEAHDIARQRAIQRRADELRQRVGAELRESVALTIAEAALDGCLAEECPLPAILERADALRRQPGKTRQDGVRYVLGAVAREYAARGAVWPHGRSRQRDTPTAAEQHARPRPRESSPSDSVEPP